MSTSDDKSSQSDSPEKNNDDRTESPSSCYKENSDSSSTSLKHKSSQEASCTDNNSVSTSKTNNATTESMNNNEDRTLDDNSLRTKEIADPLDEQSILLILPSTDVQDWKCRECGYTNTGSDTVCDTCETLKPVHPLLETRSNYVERRPSTSSSDRRSPSPDEETMYNRTASQSPSSLRRRSSTREQLSSKLDTSDKEKSSHHSSTRPRGRKSSHSYSSDENPDQSTRNTTKQRQSSKNSSEEQSPTRASAFSDRRDGKLLEDDYKSESKRTTSANDHRSCEDGSRLHSEMRSSSPLPDYVLCSTSNKEQDMYHQYGSTAGKSSVPKDKNDIRGSSSRSDLKIGFLMDVDQNEYQTNKSQQNSFSKRTSRRSQSRSPSPRADSRKGTTEQRKSPENLLKKHSPSRAFVYSDGQAQKDPEDDYKSGNKKTTDSASPIVYESHEYGKSGSIFYPQLPTSPSLPHCVSRPVLQKEEEMRRQYHLTGEKSSMQSTVSHSSLYQDNNHRSTRTITKQGESSQNPPSSSISNRDDPIVVYVPDLPVNIDNNESLENMIRQCLELKHKQKVLNVKCNTQLGIGIIYLRTNEDKNNILHVIGKIIIESSQNTTVSFVNELSLISYVVIHANDMKDLPSTNEICRRWAQLHKVPSEPKCELLSVHFSNIFRIVTHSLHELIEAMSIKEFLINNQIATVYFRADCCFFEDLPRSTNLDRLKEAIRQKITDKYMSTDSLYIQYNKDGANAVVLTSGRARIWTLHDSILLDGQIIKKKSTLAYRLLIRNVPKDISASLIRDHKIFANTVVNPLPSRDHVILELSDKNVYDKCIDQGAFSVGDHPLRIEVYTFSSNPEDREIDAESWYKTEMYAQKSDITCYISNPQHDIFRYKWNSQAFLEQFLLCKSNNRNLHGKKQDEHEKSCNHTRHLLRMTVMLNTIGIIKKGNYRMDEKEIKLKPDRLKTIVYDHKSKLQRGKTISLSHAAEFPYGNTTVKVINEDCLIVYKNLVSKGCRPVILNMANAYSAGGGYKRGDGAQEETLFRRSNYFQSLDVELDDGKPSARFYCNSNCDLESLPERKQLYPMDEFGAIYTSGLIVFRQPEDTGYAFMDIPMYDVCAIAMAAYRDPKLDDKNLLIPKYSTGARKKIENIFAIAHHRKHDCLVLSALGCGAFRNPPKHIATIFKSVIEQYAGYFKYIYFAIIDDHNTGQDINPNGNYRPFQKLLDNLNVEPKQHKIIDMMIGPWRILNQITNKEFVLSDITICYLNPCHNGGKCKDLKNDQHCREYLHPPLCPYTDNRSSCKKKNDDQHMLWFRHRLICSYGGECTVIENDLKHANEFEHPEFCHDAGKCENMDHEHLKSYRHVPLCRHRRQCVDYNRRSNDHCQKFRHCISKCAFGYFCVRFHDEKHFIEENHPFKTPCPFTPFHCRQYNTLSESTNIKTLPIDVQNHCLQYSHVCRFGRQCRETSDIHWESTIHVARNICSHNDRCKKKHQEEHLNSYSHPGIADIRRLCVHQGSACRDRRKPEHMIKYRHLGNHDHSGVIGYFGQNRKASFVENQENTFKRINDYVKNSNSKNTLSIPREIPKWIKGLQPIHRCSKVIFESILVHGHVMSREHMEHLKKPSFAAQAVQEHKRVRAIFDHYKLTAIEVHAKDYIRAIVSQEYSKKNSASPGEGIYFGGSQKASLRETPVEYDKTIHIQERFLKNMLKIDEIGVIRKCAIDIAEASWNLHTSPTGIKYAPDKVLGTDKHVFSILGPHLGHYYGDIFLVFKSEVMLHPDANFSPQAATSFASARTFTNRPWVKDPDSDSGRVRSFHESKLHCSVPGYEYAAAAELIAVTGLQKKTFDVDLKMIINRWKKADSHEVFEAHLPQLVPLSYIDEVYIPKNLFASLTPAAQESAKKHFRDSLHITNHEINLNHAGAGDYQDFVINKLIEKFEKQMELTRHLYGSVITLAPSQFQDHIVLPLRINEAYDLYRRTHKQNPNSDDTYIYWQAMYGDMMVTLSDEPINPGMSQPHIRCLVCYIAERPSTITTNYNESHSYLNAGDPYRHGVILNDGRCSSSSHSFHVGCNIEDFVTYCLKIEKKTGQVTLSHAGSNSIYCHTTITCKFSRTTLDLNKLRYIHVSAGSQKVPIRNLIITFEQIPDLHPSFDKNFKRENIVLPRKKKSPSRDHSPSSKTTQLSREKSPSIIGKAVNAVGNFFGYNPDGKKLEQCPHSINCLLQESSKHIKEFSHPCSYSEICDRKDKEPHLTHEPHQAEQCSLKGSCQKLNNPFHRAKYRHIGYPDFLIPCHNGSNCSNKTSNHLTKYSHGEQIEITKDKASETSNKSSPKPHSEHQDKASSYAGGNDQQTLCRHGSGCRDQNDTPHCEIYSHPHRHESSISPSHERILCRHGQNCRDKNDSGHCSKYSHPHEHRSKASSSSSHECTPCRHGRGCRDKNDSRHCSKFSHPQEYESSISSSQERTPCRYGRDCRDKNNPQHCSKYSHRDDQQNREHRSSDQEKISCKFGNKCYDTNPHHLSKYSH